MQVPPKPDKRCLICKKPYEWEKNPYSSMAPASLYWMPKTAGHEECAQVRAQILANEEIARQKQIRREAMLRASGMPLDLLTSKSFDNFEVDDGNRHAFTVMQSWKPGDEWGVMLQGAPGCGKTHLMLAFAHHWILHGRSIFFKRVSTMFEELRMGYETGTYNATMTQLLNHPLLVLDDIGAEKATDWVGEKLFQLLDHRLIHHLPTFFTTNWNATELDSRLHARIISRLREMAVLIGVTGDDRRGRAYKQHVIDINRRMAAGRAST